MSSVFPGSEAVRLSKSVRRRRGRKMSKDQPSRTSVYDQVFSAVVDGSKLHFVGNDEVINHADSRVTGTCQVKKTVAGQRRAAEEDHDPSGVTIGEALEAAVMTAGKKPVEWSDAAAIQAAEVRATRRTNIVPGGVAASAQSAATANQKIVSDEEKIHLADVLKGATSKLPSDKPARRKDAEGVTGAEMRNDPNLLTHPTGIAASVTAAARINQSK